MGAKKRKQGAEQVVAGVGEICKNMKIGKKLENGLGVVGGGLDWCKMIRATAWCVRFGSVPHGYNTRQSGFSGPV